MTRVFPCSRSTSVRREKPAWSAAMLTMMIATTLVLMSDPGILHPEILVRMNEWFILHAHERQRVPLLGPPP